MVFHIAGKSKRKQRSRSVRAGVTFPVGRITRKLRNAVPHARLGSAAPVYLAAVMEYLTAELLELASDASRRERRRRIKPDDIRQALRNDTELHQLCGDITISEAGKIVQTDLVNLLKVKSTKSKRSSGGSKKVKNVVVVKPHKFIKKKSKFYSTKVKLHVATATTAVPPSSSANQITDQPVVQELPALSEGTLFLGQKLSVLQGDIIHVNAQAIVHSTNNTYSTNGQVGSALLRVGGPAFQTEVSTLAATGNLPSCSAQICEMHNILAKKVIHCNIPSWNSKSGIDDLEKTVKSCLKLADKEHLTSIALPSIGSGNAGWPKQLAAETILRTISRYFQSIMASSIREVFFVLYDTESVEIYTSELRKLLADMTT